MNKSKYGADFFRKEPKKISVLKEKFETLKKISTENEKRITRNESIILVDKNLLLILNEPPKDFEYSIKTFERIMNVYKKIMHDVEAGTYHKSKYFLDKKGDSRKYTKYFPEEGFIFLKCDPPILYFDATKNNATTY